ncbi:MAG: hypothetical protein U5L75_02030 [Candidatus Campbellbacteria bacterium]|nr:hypothetical protein [Candidatus Campbellbacteria bacterium]
MDQDPKDYNNNEEQDKQFSNNNRKRSIRDISLDEELQRNTKTKPRKRIKRSRHHRGIGAGKYFIALFVVALLVFGGVMMTSIFAKATVTLVPRTENVTLDEEVELTQENTGSASLTYEVLNITETMSEAVDSEGEEEVERRAQGPITIFNTTENDEPLIANTRFETSDGRIYRIGDSVVVPGVRADGSPGSITVTVTADEPGEEYNLSEGRFTIPGLEGTELYETMYAEADSEISGGFVGVEQVIGDATEEEARENLRNSLESELQNKITESLPENKILIPGSTFIEYEDLPNTTDENAVNVRTEGTLYGIMISHDLLAGYIATENVDNYQNQPLNIINIQELQIGLTEDEINIDSIGENLTLTISGEAILEWIIEEQAVTESIMGEPRTEAITILSERPEIRDARLELVPGFMRTVPSNSEKVEVVITEEL